MKRLVSLRILCEVEEIDAIKIDEILKRRQQGKVNLVRAIPESCSHYLVDESSVRWEKGDPRFEHYIFFWGDGDKGHGERKEVTFVRHIERHLSLGQKVICKICGKNIDEIFDEDGKSERNQKDFEKSSKGNNR